MNEFIFKFSDISWGSISLISSIIALFTFLLSRIQDKNKFKKLIRNIMIVIAIFTFILYILSTIYRDFFIEMPNLKDLEYSDAIQTLGDKGITYVIANEVDVGNVYGCSVEEQSIKPGEIINKKNQTVMLYLSIIDDDVEDVIVSTNEYNVNFSNNELFPEMPILFMAKQDDAIKCLKSLDYLYDLDLKIETYIEGDYIEGDILIIINQTPYNGELLHKGSTIHLTATSSYNIDYSESTTIIN